MGKNLHRFITIRQLANKGNSRLSTVERLCIPGESLNKALSKKNGNYIDVDNAYVTKWLKARTRNKHIDSYVYNGESIAEKDITLPKMATVDSDTFSLREKIELETLRLKKATATKIEIDNAKKIGKAVDSNLVYNEILSVYDGYEKGFSEQPLRIFDKVEKVFSEIDDVKERKNAFIRLLKNENSKVLEKKSSFSTNYCGPSIEISEELEGAIQKGTYNFLKDWAVKPIQGFTTLPVNKWADTYRVMGSESPFTGPWETSRTPYLKDIMNCFNIDSTFERVVFMAASQIGKTAGVLENVMAYAIDQDPSPMMFVSSTKEGAQRNIQDRFDQVLVSSGIAKRLHLSDSQMEMDKQNKRTANKLSKKTFPGGFLIIAGARSSADLRSNSVKYLFLDELDDYPDDISGEGDPVSLAVRRTTAFSSSRKVLMVSTPSAENSSAINKHFLEGDQCEYFVPCIHCKKKQMLYFRHKDGGLLYDRDKERRPILESVRYKCIHCGGIWKEGSKDYFLKRGEWIPQAKPLFKGYKSFHISSLYSPTLMYSWQDLIKEWHKSKDTAKDLRFFQNNILGVPFKVAVQSLKYKNLLKYREKLYTSKIIPKSVKFLTFAVDVHKEHLDMEVLGWGAKRQTWSIEHVVLKCKDSSDIQEEAWGLIASKLKDYNKRIKIVAGGVDSGYNSDTVFTFCGLLNQEIFNTTLYEKYFPTVVPLKGIESSSKYTDSFLAAKRPSTKASFLKIVVDDYKEKIFDYLNLDPQNPNALNFCHFPIDYTVGYFKQLSSEMKTEIVNKKTGAVRYGWVTKEISTPNHALDLRVYNMAVLDAFLVAFPPVFPQNMISYDNITEFMNIL